MSRYIAFSTKKNTNIGAYIYLHIKKKYLDSFY